MVTKSIWTSLLVLLSLLMWTSCQPASLVSSKPMSAGVLIDEYERSSVAVRSKYDGKEIFVKGYAMTAATMPRSGDDQGSLLLEEKERGPARPVTCWFSNDQSEHFSKIKRGQHVT